MAINFLPHFCQAIFQCKIVKKAENVEKSFDKSQLYDKMKV